MFFQTNTTCGDNEYVSDKIMLIMLQNEIEYRKNVVSKWKKKSSFI